MFQWPTIEVPEWLVWLAAGVVFGYIVRTLQLGCRYLEARTRESEARAALSKMKTRRDDVVDFCSSPA